MANYQHILVLVDPEHPQRAPVRRAHAIARQCGARITACSVIPRIETYLSGMELRQVSRLQTEGKRSAKAQIKARTQDLSDPIVGSIVISGAFENALERVIGQEGIDLVVVAMAEHDIGGYAMPFHTHSSAFLEVLGVDTWFVRRINVPDVHKVLAAVDLSGDPDHPAAIPVLQRANSLSQGGELHVVYVNDTIRRRDELFSFFSSKDIESALEGIERGRLEQLQQLLAQVGVEPTALDIRRGKASRQIQAAMSDTAADLVVIGSGHLNKRGRHLGATAHNVLYGEDRSSDVLIVRNDPLA